MAGRRADHTLPTGNGKETLKFTGRRLASVTMHGGLSCNLYSNETGGGYVLFRFDPRIEDRYLVLSGGDAESLYKHLVDRGHVTGDEADAALEAFTKGKLIKERDKRRVVFRGQGPLVYYERDFPEDEDGNNADLDALRERFPHSMTIPEAMEDPLVFEQASEWLRQNSQWPCMFFMFMDDCDTEVGFENEDDAFAFKMRWW